MRRILLTTMVAVIGALIASQTWADDAEIAKEIRNGLKSLQQKGKLTGFSINIKVEDSSVWMEGTVSSQQQRDLALSVAQYSRGVTQVMNALAIASQETIASQENGQAKSSRRRASGPTAGSQQAKQVAAPQPRQTLAGHWARATTTPVDSNPVAQASAPQQTSGITKAMQPVSAPFATSPSSPVLVAATPPAIMPQQAQLAVAPQQAPPAVTPQQTQLAVAPQQTPPAVTPQQTQLAVAPQQAPPAVAPQQAQPALAPQQRIMRAVGTIAAIPVAMAAAPIAAAIAPAQQGAPIPAYQPTGAGGVQPVGHDHPYMPGYAWPAYASHPNYAALTYPRQYSAAAWPYIGPFYPYPQVPLGWRKVSLEWDDGWWFLDFSSK